MPRKRPVGGSYGGSVTQTAAPSAGAVSWRRISARPSATVASAETRIGTSLGVSTFLFFEGQEIVIDYDAEIRAGALWFYVYRPFDGELGDGVAHYLTRSGAGTWTTKVAKTGIYSVTIEPTTVRSDDRGWDMSYGVWWGARPAG